MQSAGEHKGSFHVSVCVSVISCFILKSSPHVLCVTFQFLLLCDFLTFYLLLVWSSALVCI